VTGPNENYAIVGHWRLGAGSRDLVLISATAYISQKRLQLQNPAQCAAYSKQPLPNYFGLLFIAHACHCKAPILVNFVFRFLSTNDVQIVPEKNRCYIDEQSRHIHHSSTNYGERTSSKLFHLVHLRCIRVLLMSVLVHQHYERLSIVLQAATSLCLVMTCYLIFLKN